MVKKLIARMIRPSYVVQLIEKLGDKERKSLDLHGLGEISDRINSDLITQRYLYDLYRNAQRKEEEKKPSIRAYEHYLDILSQHLGFDSFKHFSRTLENNIPDNLFACLGLWWSYVRANTGDYILKAPVRIFQDNYSKKIIMELKGQERTFSGELKAVADCMYGALESEKIKWLAVIFKLGSTQKIDLLQGVFSGISSAGIPITGREILVRESRHVYTDMSWQSLQLNDSHLHPNLQQYFQHKEENCLKIKNPTVYKVEDLTFHG